MYFSQMESRFQERSLLETIRDLACNILPSSDIHPSAVHPNAEKPTPYRIPFSGDLHKRRTVVLSCSRRFLEAERVTFYTARCRFSLLWFVVVYPDKNFGKGFFVHGSYRTVNERLE